MILAKTGNESTFFSVFYHHLKFWTLNFNAPLLLQKTFAPHGFLFNNVYLYVHYHPSKFVRLVAKHPVYTFFKNCVMQFVEHFKLFEYFVHTFYALCFVYSLLFGEILGFVLKSLKSHTF